jgi:hypothetical protein
MALNKKAMLIHHLKIQSMPCFMVELILFMKPITSLLIVILKGKTLKIKSCNLVQINTNLFFDLNYPSEKMDVFSFQR